MDINIVSQVGYFIVCFCVLVVLFTPVNMYAVEKMFLLLDKAFPKN